ncbi:hypothetical protein ACQVTX_23305 [Bacillus pretiosus]|uniref:hypothetical protein n=1 Tax=Bacillus pretiosus TaxID=2983392 RepID=UPI003D646F48
MNLNLEQKDITVAEVRKGDILVFQSQLDSEKQYYLIIEDKPNYHYHLLNLGANNLMSPLRETSIPALITSAKSKFSRLDFVEVIPAEEFELKRI